MDNKGWVSIHRRLRRNPIWDDKPYAFGQAWIDMIMRANHRNRKILFNKKIIPVQRGEFITSEPNLAHDWGWSRTKVRSFLSMLEREQAITRKADNKKTRITICNYETYNEPRTAEKQKKNIKKTGQEHQRNIDNNNNNGEAGTKTPRVPAGELPLALPNDKIEKKSGDAGNKPEYVVVPEYRKCSELLKKRILERRQSIIPEEKLVGWDNNVRLMVERDKRTVEQIEIIIDECHDMPTRGRDNFSWRNQILSMGTLREQWKKGNIYIGLRKEYDGSNETNAGGNRSGGKGGYKPQPPCRDSSGGDFAGELEGK